MWKLFTKLFEEERMQAPVVVVQEKPKELPVETEVWRQPVQVLLDSLEEGWWDFTWSYEYGIESLIFVHEWLGTELHISRYISCIDGEGQWKIHEKWMNAEESEAVVLTILKAKQKLGVERRKRTVALREQDFFKLLDLKEV